MLFVFLKWTKIGFPLLTSSNQICKMLKEPFISHTVESRLTKLAVLSHTPLKKILNHSVFLFSFLFSFHKMAPNGTVSHKLYTKQTSEIFRLSSVLIRSLFLENRSKLNKCYSRQSHAGQPASAP